MTTDITELALLVSKAKASVFTLEYISQFEPADIDSDDVDLRFEVDGRDTGTNVSIVDECGQAAKVIDELVEALEKAQKSNEFLKGQLSELANFNPDWDKLEASYESWREIAAELLVAKDRIAELEPIRVAAEKLVRCKGRYHSEQNYRALAALFGVTTPDLPPIDGESRTVKLPQRLQPGADGWDDWYVHSDDEGEYLKFDDVLAMLTAAGIKWEAE